MAIVKNSTNWLSYIAVVATKLNKAIRAGDSLAQYAANNKASMTNSTLRESVSGYFN